MAKSKCCVEGCAGTPPYFKFPTSRVLIRKWLSALSAHSGVDLKAPPGSGSVCCRHFLVEEWECTRGRVRLNRGVVPSLFDVIVKKANDSTNTPDQVPNIDNKEENNTDDSQDSSETAEELKDSDHPQKERDQSKESESPIQNCDPHTDSNVPQKESDDPHKESSDLQKDKCDPNKSSEGQREENSSHNNKEEAEKDKNSTEIQEGDSSKESVDQQKDMLGENRLANGDGTGENMNKVRDVTNQELATKSNVSLDRKKNKDKSKESTPKLPSGPRDIDKDHIEDIEDLLTYYHIKQNNIHNTSEEIPVETAPQNGNVDAMEQLEIEYEPMPPNDPVFIEISVDKDSTATGSDKNDCLMVLESVQVDVDPGSLMLPDRDEPEPEIETLEIDEDPPDEKEGPISLLSSSDEDDVIIQEPHIDTVEVSDETDEDDMPLVKLLRKRRAEKKKNVAKKVQKTDSTVARITWGLYEYYCVQCHFKTSNASEYRKHMADHAKVILMCQLCGYMTASSSQFAKHEKQHGEKTYKCELCDFKTKRNIALIYHMKTHKSHKKKSEFKCGECDYVAYSDQGILRHLRYCNDGKKHKCDKCSYSTKKLSDMKRHKSRKHDCSDKDEDYVPPSRCIN